jgi:hypothetical protein
MRVEVGFIKPRAIALIRNTTKTIGNVLQGVSQEDATTYRDGPDGWTVAEVLGHLLDFSAIFYERAKAIATEDTPTLTGYDQDQLVRDRRYNEQDIQALYTQIAANFERLASFYEGIADDQWDRAGIHPEQGHFTLTKSMLQAGTHSAVHIEQLTRVLAQKYAK